MEDKYEDEYDYEDEQPRGFGYYRNDDGTTEVIGHGGLRCVLNEDGEPL